MTDHIEFVVVGIPAPQGSKSAVRRGNTVVLLEGTTAGQRARHKAWRDAVAAAAKVAAEGREPMSGPLEVEILFRFPMPASRPKQEKVLGRKWKVTTPDLDKLARSTLDGMSGIIYTDDRTVAVLIASKYETVTAPGATITVRKLL